MPPPVIAAGTSSHSSSDQARAERSTSDPAQSPAQEQPCHGGSQERGDVLGRDDLSWRQIPGLHGH